ncbi:MAG: hypothetical protein DMF66_12170 [Acidobacteria bacterium]|nr:MAG: hypothetical protein DMF66_12170 [Acidobacteriota bacterium]
MIYYFAPDARDQDWKWITPGSFVGVVLWLLVSFAFKTYLYYFNSYNKTYGTLGGVIILMLWFYFTGAAILVGGEINSEIENEMARQGAPDAKEKGEKSPDERGRANANRGGEPRRARASTTKERPRTRSAHGRVTRMDGHEEEGFSLGKLAVVLGAWALSKVGLSRTERKTQ